jgi:LPXTG-motif cell wall-anchored protein
MDDWLVGRFTIFGMTGQNWMLVAGTMILVSIAIALWRRS